MLKTKTDNRHRNGNFKGEDIDCGIIVRESSISTENIYLISDNISSFYELVVCIT